MLTTSWNEQIAQHAQGFSAYQQGLERHRSGEGRVSPSVVRNGTFLDAFIAAATGAADRLLAMAARPVDEIEIAAKGIESSVYKAILAGEKPKLAYQTVAATRDTPTLKSVGFMAFRQGVTLGLDALLADPQPKAVETYLGIAEFLKSQAPYVEGTLGEAWVHPTEAQIDAVRSILPKMQDSARAERISARLTKLLAPVESASAPAAPAAR